MVDKFRSYTAAKSEVAPSLEHRQHKEPNNLSEASHRHTLTIREDHESLQLTATGQRFLSVHGRALIAF